VRVTIIVSRPNISFLVYRWRNFDYSMLQFKTEIVRVQRDENDGWKVETVAVKSNESRTEHFDALFVCNGSVSVLIMTGQSSTVRFRLIFNFSKIRKSDSGHNKVLIKSELAKFALHWKSVLNYQFVS
jgi:hypothetical protein